jgi:hypothetical protein
MKDKWTIKDVIIAIIIMLIGILVAYITQTAI